MFANVLLVVDGSEGGRRCASACLELVATTGGRVHALCVTAPIPAVAMAADLIEGDACQRREADRAAAWLDEVARMASARGVSVVTRHVVDHRRAIAILDAAEKDRCDLIVLHGHANETRLFRHVAHDVARDSAAPVLVFP